MNEHFGGLNGALSAYLMKASPGTIAESEWRQINEETTCHRYKKGQDIFREQEEPKALYFVSKGTVKLHRATGSGKKYILYIAKSGEFIGHRSLLSKEHYAATATALEEVSVCALPKDLFFRLCEKEGIFMNHLVKMACQRMGALEADLADLAYSPVLERLAARLLMLCEVYGVRHPQRGVLIDIVISREDMASIIGSATETVIRLLSKLKTDGVLSFEGKKICIEKPERLKIWAGKAFTHAL